MAINVYFTNGTGQSLNRWEMLLWIHKNSDINHSKIEELCSGAAYCRLFNKLFPGSIPETKIKYHANQEYEYVCNYKLLQKAFDKMKVRQAIPVDRLVKGKFQDNYEFAQYFQKLFQTNLGNLLQGQGVAESGNEVCGTYRKEKISSKTSVTSEKLDSGRSKTSVTSEKSNSGHCKKVERNVSPKSARSEKQKSIDLAEGPQQVGDSFEKSKEPFHNLYSKEHLENSLKINEELLAKYENLVKEKEFYANKILQAKSFLKDYPVTEENKSFLQKANAKLDMFIQHYGLLPKELHDRPKEVTSKHTHIPSPIESWKRNPQKSFDDIDMRDMTRDDIENSFQDDEVNEQEDSTPRASKTSLHKKVPEKEALVCPGSAKIRRVHLSHLPVKKNAAITNTLKCERPPIDTCETSSSIKKICRLSKQEGSPVTLKTSLGKFVGGISFRRQNYPDITSPEKGNTAIQSPTKKPTICEPSNAGGERGRSRLFFKQGEH